MTQGASHRRRRLARAQPALPVVPIRNRYDMAVALARYGGLLRDYARRYLELEATDDEVEEAVRGAVDWLLALEEPDSDHGLRYATQALWRECQRVVRRRDRRRAPVDPRLGVLSRPAVARVLKRLGPVSRATLIRAAQGETPEEIARSEEKRPEVIRLRLFRARQRALKLLREQGGALWAGTQLLPVRARSLARWMPLGEQAVGTAGAWGVGALAPLIFSAVLWPITSSSWPTARLFTSSPTMPPVSQAGPVVEGGLATHATSTGIRPVASWSNPEPTGSASVPPPPHAPRVAADETPEDMLLTAASAAPDYTDTHTVVALGVGRGCQCWAILQSTDGGATWTGGPGPLAGGNQVVLPPSYPRDPRIFIGTDAAGSAVGSWTPSFKSSFASLSLPPGQLALPAGFDQGDHRVLVAGTGSHGGVWSDDLSTGFATPVLAYPTDALATAVLATPSGDPTSGVFVWAPPASYPVGGTGIESLTSTSLFHCPPTAACTPLATLPQPNVGVLAISPDFVHDRTLAAAFGSEAVSSVDGGHSFAPAALPTGSFAIESLSVSAGGSWLVTAHANGRTIWHMTSGTPWRQANFTAEMATHDGQLVALGLKRMIEVLVSAGYRCSADDGHTWTPRCPPEP